MIQHRDPSADAVRAGLERVLASPGFANAGRLSRLLRHVVEKTLAGESDQLKEYSVGIEVFDRDDRYDPRVDSIVRVEAGRLRSRLDAYYATEGARDGVRISLPRGGYVAQFEEPAAAAVDLDAAMPQKDIWRRSWAAWAFGAGLLMLIGGIATWLPASAVREGPPSVAVLAIAQYSASAEDGDVAALLTESVTTELARLGTVSVVSHTSAMQFAGVRKPLREIAAALDADFIVEAAIENVDLGIRVTARVVNAKTDRKMWVQDYEGRTDDLRLLSRAIAGGVSTAVLGQSARRTPGTNP